MAAVARTGAGLAAAGWRVRRHLHDAAVFVHPDDVEAYLAVIHPVSVIGRLVVDEEHAAAFRQAGASHQAVFALGVRSSQFHMDG